MNIYKVRLIPFIFLYFTWLKIAKIILFIEFLCYLHNSKQFLLQNINYINIFFYNLITFYELSYYYFIIGLLKFKKSKIHKKSIKNIDFNMFLDDLEKI